MIRKYNNIHKVKKMRFKHTVLMVFFLALSFINQAIAEDASASSLWQGQYFGVTGGFSTGTADPTVNVKEAGYFTVSLDAAQVDPEASRDMESTDLSTSLFWGLNRHSGNLLYGVEADLSFTDYNKNYESRDIVYDSAPTTTFSVMTNVKSNLAVSLRPRLGYTLNKSLFYASYGPVYRKFDYNFRFTDTFQPQEINVNESEWKLGWAFTLGYEYKMFDTWSLKTEYFSASYEDVVDTQSTTLDFPDDGFTHKMDFEEQGIRVGLYKRF